MTGENLKKLDAWYASVKPDKELTLEEARTLNYKVRDLTSGREPLIEELVLGTLHAVYSYLKNFHFIDYIGGSYDIDDIISSFCEAWIENLEMGLYKRDSYFTMFNGKFFEGLNKKLGINEKNYMFPHIFRADFDNMFFDFFYRKNNGEDITYADFLENIEKNNEKKILNGTASVSLREEYTRFYKILDKSFDIYSRYGNHDIPFSKGYIRFLRDFLIEMAISEYDDCYNVGYEFSGYDVIVEEERNRAVIESLERLNKNESKVITLNYGLNGGDCISCEDIGKLLDRSCTKQRVFKIRKKALGKIRYSSKGKVLKDFYEN